MSRPRTLRPIAAACACFALAIGPAGAGRKPQAPLAQERIGDPITVDFSAIGADGRALTNLGAADVSIRIDGRPRIVRSVQIVSASDGAEAAPASILPPPYASSVATGGRTVLVVLDEDSVRAGREGRLREAVAAFLTGLTRRDRVSLITTPYGGVKVPLTDDHLRVSRALMGMAGQAPQSETGSEMACRTRRVLESLVGLFGSMGTRREPVTVMLFSSGLAGPRRDRPLTLAPGMCELTKDHFQQVGAAAARARANFYVIQPDDMPQIASAQTETIAGANFIGSDNPLEGLENLAGVTGGERIHLATTAAPLTRVLNETAAYYVAVLEPQPSDRNGRTHQLDVRVARPGTSVRARPAIEFARTDPQTPAVRANAREMLRVSDGFSDVPVRAAGYVSRNAGDAILKIVFVAEPIDRSIRLASAAAALINEQGRLVAQWTAADLDAVPLMGALLAPPGTYRLRVAATDAAGRGGTVDDTVVAELVPAGALKLSSLVLGLSRHGAFVPTLEFAAEPVALASFEIYGGAAGAPLRSALEVAATPDGPTLANVRLALERVTDGHYIATGAIPLGALPPGDFIVRATVAIEGQPAGRISRTLRKSVR